MICSLSTLNSKSLTLGKILALNVSSNNLKASTRSAHFLIERGADVNELDCAGT